MSDDRSSGAMEVFLHPLVIINISDHHTRERVGLGKSGGRIFGVLLGTQSGRRVEIINSFEMVLKKDKEKENTSPTIDKELLQLKVAQCMHYLLSKFLLTMCR